MKRRITGTSGWSARPRDGSALVTVMVLSAAMLVSAAVVLVVSQRTAFFSGKMKRDTSAMYDAEAGISIMLDVMTVDRDAYMYWTANRTLVTNFNEATLTVTTSTRTNMTTGAMTSRISSTATFGEESRETIIEASWVPIWFYQIVSKGDIDLDSAGFDIWGDVHSNGDIDGGSGGGAIHGNVTASGPLNTQVAIPPWVSVANQPLVDMDPYDARPSFPDWKSMAQSGGIYVAGDWQWDNDVLNPSNGVVYVEGNVTMRRGCEVVGVVVVVGDVDISQRYEQSSPTFAPPSWWVDDYEEQYGTNWPCLLVGGDITERNANEWTYPGAFFAAGEITLRNRRTFGGSMVSLEKVYIKNRVWISNTGYALTNAIDLDMGAWLK